MSWGSPCLRIPREIRFPPTTMKASALLRCDSTILIMSAFGINASGTYQIDGDQIIITYNLLGQEYTWEQSFSQSGKVINIGGTEFKK